MLKYTQECTCMQKHAQVCKIMLKYAKAQTSMHKGLWKPAQVC